MTSQPSRGRKASPDDSATSNCSSLTSYTSESDHDDDMERAKNSLPLDSRHHRHQSLPQSISYRRSHSSLQMNSNASQQNTSISPPRDKRRSKRYGTPPSMRSLNSNNSEVLPSFTDCVDAENLGESKYKKNKIRPTFIGWNLRSTSVFFSICMSLCFICSFVGHWIVASSLVGVPHAIDVHERFRQRPSGTKSLNFYLSGNDQADWSEKKRFVDTGSSEVTDPSQQYHLLDSNDKKDREVMQHMERKPAFVDGDCKPMKEWQTKSFPTCNAIHEVDMGADNDETSVLGVKGFFRMAWKFKHASQGEAVAMKTLKMVHTFEENFYEKHRIDALGMERLTSSPHVINIYGYCGQTVFNELADGRSLGKLADKSTYLERLDIAIDVAEGIAAVHGIDGEDEYASLVHFDINPGNVISIGGTLKLNDFNISVWRKWNSKTQKPCTFPPIFPNPQWRSPEEAKKTLYLDEKVDVFSMGHIFFRLICGKSPWGKLDNNPTKEEIHASVLQGKLPHIPSKVTKSDNPIIIAIREAMMKAYTNDPKERPSARSIANGLIKARDLILKHEKEKKERDHHKEKHADQNKRKHDEKKHATDQIHENENEEPKRRLFRTSRASVE